jgi:hypothetical protein
MDENWKIIFTASKMYEVQIIKGLLAENDIESVEISKKDSAFLFGRIELYVHTDDVLQAKQIISKSNLSE